MFSAAGPCIHMYIYATCAEPVDRSRCVCVCVLMADRKWTFAYFSLLVHRIL